MINFCPIHQCPLIVHENGSEAKCMWDDCTYEISWIHNDNGSTSVLTTFSIDIPFQPNYSESDNEKRKEIYKNQKP